jgi:hypothetical protein
MAKFSKVASYDSQLSNKNPFNVVDVNNLIKQKKSATVFPASISYLPQF